jgi:hypothetical protein
MADAQQIRTVADNLQKAVADAPPLPHDQPRVPFQTALKLTAEQEKKMLDHAFKRLDEISNDMGRNQTLNPTWWATSRAAVAAAGKLLATQGAVPVGETFLGKRSRFDATFYNDVTWRPYTMGVSSIFWDSNLAVPLSRRICRQMIAKAQESFFGSDPWFSVDPAPEPSSPIDDELASEIERFCRFKLGESHSEADKKRAISRALILGECAVKTSYVVRDQLFDIEAIVLTDVEGLPIRSADGNTITQDDQWKDAEDGTGQQVLARDGQTPMPDAPIWQKQILNRRQVLFEGTRSEPIYYKDFLCPITAQDVQTADCVVHLYDKSVMEFVDLIVKRGMADNDPQGRMEAMQKMLAMVNALQNNSEQSKSAATVELRPNENYYPAPSATNGPVAEFAEFYMWFDANEDGIAENIMLIADRKNQSPIFYDNVPNVTTDGLRPIEIVRINPVEGRWYGQGLIELFESYQIVCDLMVNRWNFSQSRSGRIDFWDPTSTQEGDADPSLRLNWGGTYTLKPGKKAEDALSVVYLNDVKFEKIQTMLQFFMQMAMNESGVANANDNMVAGMEQAKLATGIVQIEKSGDELSKPIIADLEPALTAITNREVNVTLANMNPQEAYTYLEGDNVQIGTLTPDDVRGLRFKVKIELTTHKNQQQLQLNAQATALVKDFYLQPPQVQVHIAGFIRAQLRALVPKCNADEVIVPLGMGPVGPDGQPATPGAPGQPQPASAKPVAATAMPTQLGQTHSQMPGVSAPGGTPGK